MSKIKGQYSFFDLENQLEKIYELDNFLPKLDSLIDWEMFRHTLNKVRKNNDTGEAVAFWFGSREHGNLDKFLELLLPLRIYKVYADGNYAYYERVDAEVLVVSKKNTQKIECKHLSLRTWSSRLVRKGIRFSKTEKMHKISVGLTINYWFFRKYHLIQ